MMEMTVKKMHCFGCLWFVIILRKLSLEKHRFPRMEALEETKSDLNFEELSHGIHFYIRLDY